MHRTGSPGKPQPQNNNPYLEGHGDLVSRLLITAISHVITPNIPIINLLTKSPSLSSKAQSLRPALCDSFHARGEGYCRGKP